MQYLGIAAAVFGISFLLLDRTERWWHKLHKNKDTSYRWGVWLFAVLLSLYAYLTSLGR